MNRFLRSLLNRGRTWVKPRWFLISMILVYIAFEATYAYVRWFGNGRQFELEMILSERDVAIFFFVAAAGFLRGRANHPLYWADYGRWLARTPWRPPKPLPLGPVHLALSDLLFNLIVVLALDGSSFNLLCVPLLFLTGYLLVVCASLWRTGIHVYAYILAFGLGLVIRLWSNHWDAAAAAVILYLPASLGLRKSLLGFPWGRSMLPAVREPRPRSAARNDLHARLAQNGPKSLGWPFDSLRPGLPADSIHPRHGTLLSALLAWWIYVIAAPLEIEFQRGLLIMCLIAFPFAMAVVRLKHYTDSYHSPISPWGRLLTFRWIIPGYDKVVAAPLLAEAISWVALLCFIWDLQLEPLLVAPIGIACASLITLNMGPTLREWQHTGKHRLAPKYTTMTHFRL